MGKVLIHVVAEKGNERIRLAVEAVSDFTCINEKRFAKYGILTGEVSPEHVGSIRAVVGVKSVDVDGPKYTQAVVVTRKAWTDYPFVELGDEPNQPAPWREVEVLSYDGNKYCQVKVDGVETSVKAGYLRNEPPQS